MAPMTKVGSVAAVALTVLALLWGQAVAQSNCMSVIIGLAPCLNFVTGSSSIPSTSCCSQLASVVQSQPRCLCTVLNGGGASLGVSINQTLALALPGACNVQTPPVSRCNAGGPATAPNLGPAGSPQASPGSDDTTSDPSITGGSKETSSSSSNANSVSVSVQFIFLMLIMASSVSAGLRAV